MTLSPNNKLALFTRGQSLAYQHEYAAAAEDLEKVIAIDPLSRKGRFLLAGVYSRAGRVKEASDNCHVLVRLDRKNAGYAELCGLVAHRAGDFATAGHFYGIARRIDAKLPDIDENFDRAGRHMVPVGSGTGAAAAI